jgi:uncharacterized membrane protein
MSGLWPDFRRDERGNMAILFAFGFTVSALVSAVAVDAAALYHERRLLQAGVDLAAISAAADPSRAAEIAQSVLVGARLLAPASTDGLTVVTGRYDPTLADIAARFGPGETPANAVSVSMTRAGALHFAGGLLPQPTIGAAGIATVSPEVSFSLGSRLASLNGGLLNAVLTDLLGTSVSLSVADYTALVATRVSLLSFLDALATELGVTAGTYDDLLALDAPAGVLAAALASLTSGPTRAGLQAIAAGGNGHPVALSGLVTLGRLGGMQLGGATGAGPSVGVFDVLAAAASLADGDRQVAVNLGATLPGLLSLGLDLAVGEREQHGGWLATGTTGTALRTAQVRLRLRAEMLGGAVLLGAGVRLPLWFDLAPAEAVVVSATCPSPQAPNGSASIAVRPGIARMAIGDLSNGAMVDFGLSPPVLPVNLVDVLMLRVRGSAQVELAQAMPVVLAFTSADIAAGTSKTAATGTALGGLLTQLLADLDLTVSVLGLGLAPPATIAQATRNLLATALPTLDATVVAALQSLGLALGEADIRVHGVRCDHAVLVG